MSNRVVPEGPIPGPSTFKAHSSSLDTLPPSEQPQPFPPPAKKSKGSSLGGGGEEEGSKAEGGRTFKGEEEESIGSEEEADKTSPSTSLLFSDGSDFALPLDGHIFPQGE